MSRANGKGARTGIHRGQRRVGEQCGLLLVRSMARVLGTGTPTLYFRTTGVALCFIPRSLDLLQVPEAATRSTP